MAKRREPGLKQGEPIPLSIRSVAFGGEGVGRTGDLIVFVPLTAPGDEGLVEIVEVRKTFARGRLIRLDRPSPWRRAPRCPHFGLCGGCAVQHIAYNGQLALKQAPVRDAFVRIGRFGDGTVAEILPSPSPWGYRIKADVHVAVQPTGRTVVGFKQRKGHSVFDVESCAIVSETVNEALHRLRRNVAEKRRLPEGRWTLWAADGGGGERPDRISRTIKGRRFSVPRNGFFQANAFLTETLVDTVLDGCALTGSETVVDAYCGSGLFSVFLAHRCGRLIGIEAEGDAASAARENLRTAGCQGGRIQTGDVGAVLARGPFPPGERVDVLVLDPPRTGVGPGALQGIVALRPRRIVYVSCNPATMARDCRCLADFGYRLGSLQPLDMFPQTAHMEVVGLLLLEGVS